MRLLVLLLLTALAASCGNEVSPRRDVTLEVPQAPLERLPPPQDTQPMGQTTAGLPCVRQWPARLRLRGVLQREVQLGPPGYGESPEQDRRDTILVLVLAHPLPVCPSLGAPPGSGPETPVSVARLSLSGRTTHAVERLGEPVTVFGTLHQQVLAPHPLPMHFSVDSMPYPLPKPRRERQASRATCRSTTQCSGRRGPRHEGAPGELLPHAAS